MKHPVLFNYRAATSLKSNWSKSREQKGQKMNDVDFFGWVRLGKDSHVDRQWKKVLLKERRKKRSSDRSATGQIGKLHRARTLRFTSSRYQLANFALLYVRRDRRSKNYVMCSIFSDSTTVGCHFRLTTCNMNPNFADSLHETIKYNWMKRKWD